MGKGTFFIDACNTEILAKGHSVSPRLPLKPSLYFLSIKPFLFMESASMCNFCVTVKHIFSTRALLKNASSDDIDQSASH